MERSTSLKTVTPDLKSSLAIRFGLSPDDIRDLFLAANRPTAENQTPEAIARHLSNATGIPYRLVRRALSEPLPQGNHRWFPHINASQEMFDRDTERLNRDLTPGLQAFEFHAQPSTIKMKLPITRTTPVAAARRTGHTLGRLCGPLAQPTNARLHASLWEALGIAVVYNVLPSSVTCGIYESRCLTALLLDADDVDFLFSAEENDILMWVLFGALVDFEDDVPESRLTACSETFKRAFLEAVSPPGKRKDKPHEANLNYNPLLTTFHRAERQGALTRERAAKLLQHDVESLTHSYAICRLEPPGWHSI